MTKPYLNAILASTAVATVLLSPVNATAQTTNTYLQIDGVLGESVDKVHKGEIDVLSWTWGESNPFPATTGGGVGAGKPVTCINDLVVTKDIDRATPHLLTSTITNDTFLRAKLTVRSNTGTPSALDYFSVTMGNVTITSYSVTGTDQRPTEKITLHFNSAVGQYVPVNPFSGVALTPITWTVSENGGIGNPLCP
jgi:type VI secretion system secreted protein Hcp